MQLGRNRLPHSPPFSQKQPFQEVTWRLTEEDTHNRNPSEGSTAQHPHPAEAQDKGQDQDKNGREGQKDKSTVMMHLQFFGLIQELALLLEPSSSFWLEFSFSCFMISIGCPASWGPAALRRRRRQGSSQLSSPTCLEAGLLCEYSPIHKGEVTPPSSLTETRS
ncbi:unnamed protein product [Rangifer tarandus platyrhynchus]|uniref:Uncharacterized protein n=1 Tax=Rangifer tarandus platyrhynchus TaxID=3082113 RepID=A0ABN8YY88_RANTA|nr:unnamed protein product [Rangifer tarandus platyrhynchus]